VFPLIGHILGRIPLETWRYFAGLATVWLSYHDNPPVPSVDAR